MKSITAVRLSKKLHNFKKWVFSVACYVGFASCKTFGKQPKRPCFGRSPKRGEGGSPTLSPGTDAGRVCTRALHDAKPTKHTQPFTGERGQGDRDNKSEVNFKNRLFLQSDRLTLTGKPVCFLHSEQACPFYSTPAMINSRQYIRKRHFLLYFPYFLISR